MSSVTTSWISCTAVADQLSVFMSMRLEQIHEKKIKTSCAAHRQSSACSLFPGKTMFIPGGNRMKNTKTDTGQILWSERKCVWLCCTRAVVNWPFIFERFCLGYMSGMHHSDLTLRSFSLKMSHFDERRKWITSDLAFALPLFKNHPICYA